ncbi:MAG: radical SAM protein [Acidobacteria bacterium]|nr:radical SAM protein [Acidobacteriota bacterium]
MEPSAFNVRVPLSTGDVFLMNTLTDAQVVVSADAARLVDRPGDTCEDTVHAAADVRDALATFAEHGFLVQDRTSEQAALARRFHEFREDTSQLRITILTTLQCNFACDYCYQGDHAAAGRPAPKMSLETSARVAEWIAGQLDAVNPRRLVLTFFGGEPLLNTPAMIDIAGRCWQATQARGVRQLVSIITNGLLLSPAIVDRMLPFGLTGVKVTLDGDRATHDRVRPARGGEGTFDRIIANIRRVADRTPVAIGGNFDGSTAGSYPALLDFLKSQDFAGRISKVTFKPVIAPRSAEAPAGSIPLTDVGTDRPSQNGSCMSVAGSGGASACDSCRFADDQMATLREETKRHGFSTADGVHMGPCELYRRHSHTIGPDGSRYACPGFTGANALAIGNIAAGENGVLSEAASQIERLAPWHQCGDCSFVPVCGGGCAVASHAELGDMKAPSCHKRAFESALIALAEDTAGAIAGGLQ